MEKEKQMFVDGIANLSYRNGTFRFQLATYTDATRTEKGETKTVLNMLGQVIMTPQAFIQTVEAMQRFVKEVEDKGIIRVSKNPEQNQDIEDEVTKQ